MQYQLLIGYAVSAVNLSYFHRWGNIKRDLEGMYWIRVVQDGGTAVHAAGDLRGPLMLGIVLTS